LERFKVVFSKVAAKDLNKFNPKTRLRILKAVQSLQLSPFPKGNSIKKIKGTRVSLYRLRIGDFRAVYHINGSEVTILLIVNRKNLEQKLKTF